MFFLSTHEIMYICKCVDVSGIPLKGVCSLSQTGAQTHTSQVLQLFVLFQADSRLKALNATFRVKNPDK